MMLFMTTALKAALPANVPGKYFVDASCIDCDTCRWMAPEIFGRAEGKSFVAQQPTQEQEEQAALAARACPTGSIRTKGKPARVEFPVELLPGVFHAGYHSEKSFGATPYVVEIEGGCVLVDSPRYNSKLAKIIEERFGTPKLMLLTHVDDVGDHDKWHTRFPDMRRVIHELEVRGPDQWPYSDLRDVELVLKGDGKWALEGGITAIFVPGHSRGHLAYLAADKQAIFTGDHLALNARLGRLDGFGRYGWNSDTQSASIAKLADEDFLHLFPGHGRLFSFKDADDRRSSILTAAAIFKDDPLGRASTNPPLYVTA